MNTLTSKEESLLRTGLALAERRAGHNDVYKRATFELVWEGRRKMVKFWVAGYNPKSYEVDARGFSFNPMGSQGKVLRRLEMAIQAYYGR